MRGYTLARVRRGEILVSRGAALAVSALAIMVLVGWYVAVPALTSVVPGSTATKPNTAVAFLVTGLALWLGNDPRHARARRALALVAVALGAATLLEFLSGRSLGIDEILLRDRSLTHFPGRPAAITAATLTLLGLALAIRGRSLVSRTLSQALAVLATLAPMLAIVGYLYGVPLLYGANVYGANVGGALVGGSSTPMALHTAIGALVLALGILLSRPDDGLMRIFLADSGGGIVARVLIPIALLFPVLLGGLFIRYWLDAGHPQSAMAFLVIAIGMASVTVLWWLAFRLHRHEQDRASAQDDAETDALTGMRNRRYFDLRLAEEIKRSDRFKSSFGLVLFDLDHFKALNDTVGHQAGDAVLRRTAQVVRRTLRDIDIACRYGGEEFAIIAPSTIGDRAVELAERLRIALVAERFPAMADGVTMSAGISQYPDHGTTPDKLLRVADAALYAAKEGGRNQVVHGRTLEPVTGGGASGEWR